MWAGAATGGTAPAYTSLPTGYLLCDGSAISRSTYATLFAAISTRYGVGNGTTTFNLPTLTTQLPLGLAAGGTVTNAGTTATGAQSATHTHGTNFNTGGHSVTHTHDTVVYYNGGSTQTKTSGGASVDHVHLVNGTTNANTTSHNHTINTTTVHYIIKT